MQEIKTQDELVGKLKLLGIEDEDVEKRNEITCSLVGHSRIQEFCFGYYTCARCGQQLGDSLGSIYPDADKVVIVGHDCPVCRENYKKLTWKDKIFCPDPFENSNQEESANDKDKIEGENQ